MNYMVYTYDLQTVILLLVMAYLIHYYTTYRRLPPGPWGIPVLGYLPFLRGKMPHVAMNELSKKYGNVISLYLGSLLVIVLGDYESIKEAFVTQGYVFSGRPKNMPVRTKDSDKGLTLADGNVAFQHRRVILSSLRDFGVGKTTLEIKIMDEIKHYLLEIKNSNGQPINIKMMTGLTVANIIVLFQFGKRYDYSDANIVHLRQLMDEATKFAGASAIRIILPWTQYLPLLETFTGTKLLTKTVGEFQQFFSKKLAMEENSHVAGNRSNYVQSYLTERNEIIQQKGTDQDFDIDYLVDNLWQLFGAGSETMTTTLMWGILYTIKYPEVLKGVQKEIDDVIGPDRDPAMSDKINMPYTEATMFEIQRYVTILPLSLVHSNMAETKIFGHCIPNHSYVVANIYAVHHDKTLWGDPENFRPERFLTPDGRVSKPEYFIPFSIGKRNCIGEPLAQMELFLYFTSLLQQFNFKLPGGGPPSLEPVVGITTTPKPFKVCAVPR